MSKSYRQPTSMDVTSFMDKAGQFHFLVNKVDEEPTTKDGAALDGIRVELTCQGGICRDNPKDDSQVKRPLNVLLFNPSESHRDGGEFATKVHLRLADACCLLPKADAGEEVDIDWSKAAGRQIVAFVNFSKPKEGKEPMLQIDGAHIYHVDDPNVAHVPKNQAVLKLLPAALRRMTTDKNDARNQQPTAGAKAASNPAKSASPAANGKQPVGAGAASGNSGGGADYVDPNDI